MPAKNQSLKPTAIIYLTASLCLSALSLQTQADVYKWTDKDGNIHYSDIKPNEISSSKLNIKTTQASQNRPPAQEKANALDENKAKQLQNQAEKLQEETKKRELDAQCQNLRDNLKTIQENSRIKVNENGEIRVLSPEELESKKQNMLEQLKEFCTE